MHAVFVSCNLGIVLLTTYEYVLILAEIVCYEVKLIDMCTSAVENCLEHRQIHVVNFLNSGLVFLIKQLHI